MNVTDRDIEAAIRALPHLKELCLANCMRLSEFFPSLIQKSYPTFNCIALRLETLDLRGCWQYNEEALRRVLVWSMNCECRLKSAAFKSLWIRQFDPLNKEIKNKLCLIKMQLDPQTPMPCLIDHGFFWSSLRILMLNNTHLPGIQTFSAIVECCPNLAVIGLGGSEQFTSDIGYAAELPFFASFLHVAEEMEWNKDIITDIKGVAAFICALFVSLEKLWMVEMTFFPTEVFKLVIDWFNKTSYLSSLQKEAFVTLVDFNDTKSCLDFYHSISKPFEKFLYQRANGKMPSNDLLGWKFDQFPSSFLKTMIQTATWTTPFEFNRNNESATTVFRAIQNIDKEHYNALRQLGVPYVPEIIDGALFKVSFVHVIVILHLLGSKIRGIQSRVVLLGDKAPSPFLQSRTGIGLKCCGFERP